MLSKAVRTRFGVPRVASALAVMLAACGGTGTSTSRTVEPAAYVGTVCRAVMQWNEGVASAFQATEERPDDDRSAVLRRDILDFFGDIQDATDAMVERVEEAGFPDIPDGVEVAGALREGLATAADRLRANRDGFGDIALSDVQPAASLEGAMTEYADQVTAVYSAVEQLDERSPELRQARQRESSCRGLRALE